MLNKENNENKLPIPHLVMAVKQKNEINSTSNIVETNTENQLMRVISILNVLTLRPVPLHKEQSTIQSTQPSESSWQTGNRDQPP